MDTCKAAVDLNVSLMLYVYVFRAAFTRLLDRFSVFYIIPQYNSEGDRPRKLQQHHQVLGLLLAFYVGSMKNNALIMIFGVPPSILSRVLKDAEKAFSLALNDFPAARVA